MQMLVPGYYQWDRGCNIRAEKFLLEVHACAFVMTPSEGYQCMLLQPQHTENICEESLQMQIGDFLTDVLRVVS